MVDDVVGVVWAQDGGHEVLDGFIGRDADGGVSGFEVDSMISRWSSLQVIDCSIRVIRARNPCSVPPRIRTNGTSEPRDPDRPHHRLAPEPGSGRLAVRPRPMPSGQSLFPPWQGPWALGTEE